MQAMSQMNQGNRPPSCSTLLHLSHSLGDRESHKPSPGISESRRGTWRGVKARPGDLEVCVTLHQPPGPTMSAGGPFSAFDSRGLRALPCLCISQVEVQNCSQSPQIPATALLSWDSTSVRAKAQKEMSVTWPSCSQACVPTELLSRV